jgi:hypothetical protein
MKRTLIKSATIISMDDALGDFRTDDLLVESDRIASVRPEIDLGSGANKTEIIVIPRLIPPRIGNGLSALGEPKL